jgi:hypothetical protein
MRFKFFLRSHGKEEALNEERHAKSKYTLRRAAAPRTRRGGGLAAAAALTRRKMFHSHLHYIKTKTFSMAGSPQPRGSPQPSRHTCATFFSRRLGPLPRSAAGRVPAAAAAAAAAAARLLLVHYRSFLPL